MHDEDEDEFFEDEFFITDVYEYTAVVVDTMRECASLLVVVRSLLEPLGVTHTDHLIDEAVVLTDAARDLERLLLAQKGSEQ